MKYNDSNINNSILKLSKHVWKNINSAKKDFDNFLRRTENFKNECSNLSSETETEIVLETEKETKVENFKKNIDKNSVHDKNTDDRTYDVNTDASILPIPHVNEIHTNIVYNNIQELAPETQINETSSKDKKEEINIPSIF